jgi:hypothetical protein
MIDLFPFGDRGVGGSANAGLVAHSPAPVLFYLITHGILFCKCWPEGRTHLRKTTLWTASGDIVQIAADLPHA